MDKGGGLKGVIGPLVLEVMGCDLPQLLIQNLDQLGKALRIFRIRKKEINVLREGIGHTVLPLALF